MPITIYFTVLAVVFWALLKAGPPVWKSIGILLVISLAGSLVFQSLATLGAGHTEKFLPIAVFVQVLLGVLLGSAIYLFKRIRLRLQNSKAGSNRIEP